MQLTSEAQSDIRSLIGPIQARILDKLEWMGVNAVHIQHQTLKGKQWHGLFKYRVGDYRIIYQLDTAARQLIILKVAHRREVYK
ncbi:MAG: type II toxin-antitoxin system RelE/ParE family toxin [Chloroflexi bacterium]|nr:type II toxin-antitoxin system RelE/ParE family toxin [Chloroflexota bacterium]